MEPGPELAAVLASVDLGELPGYDLILALKAAKRMASHFEAVAFRAMAAIWDRMAELDNDPEFALLAASAEIRAALRLTRRAGDNALGMAWELKERLPQVGQALHAGEIDLPRVWVIVRGTGHLTTETAREVVDRVIEEAPRLTTGQLHARIRKLCVEADPEEAEQRYKTAVEGRQMVAEATPEGTGNLMGLDLPAVGPRLPNAGRWRPGIGPVCSPDVGCRPGTATWTIGCRGQRGAEQPSAIWRRAAATTTSSDTAAGPTCA